MKPAVELTDGLVDVEPVGEDALEIVAEGLEVDGFRHVAVGADPVGGADVLVVLGRGQDDDGNLAAAQLAPDALADGMAWDVGKLEVEEDEIEALLLGGLLQSLDGLLPVAGGLELAGGIGGLDRVLGQADAVRVVLDQEDLRGLVPAVVEGVPS